MQLLTIADIAKQANVSQSTARFYRDKYNEYFSYVGEGRARRYLVESIEAMEIIIDGYKQKQPSPMIENRLQERFGILEQKTTNSKQQTTAITNTANMAELEQAMRRTISSAVASSIQAEIQPLKYHMQMLNEKLDKQNEALNNHYNLVDERLRALREVRRESWWQRLFE